jgi:hypothetical protein
MEAVTTPSFTKEELNDKIKAIEKELDKLKEIYNKEYGEDDWSKFVKNVIASKSNGLMLKGTINNYPFSEEDNSYYYIVKGKWNLEASKWDLMGRLVAYSTTSENEENPLVVVTNSTEQYVVEIQLMQYFGNTEGCGYKVIEGDDLNLLLRDVEKAYLDCKQTFNDLLRWMTEQ